jgi:hypothetical protein
MSAKTRLFLTIERLKNLMYDPQMRFPFWEQFFPLLGDANSVDIDLGVLSELINEAAVAAENLLLTQGGAIYSQYLYGANAAPAASAAATATNRLPVRRAAASAPTIIDTKKYTTFADKTMNYFVSAGTTSVSFRVKDLIMLYVYVSHTPKYRPLFDFMEAILFRKEKECMPVVSSEVSSILLDNLRDLTGITNVRLDYESLMNVNVAVQRAANNELSKYPLIKVRDYITNVNVYDKVTEPCKAFGDKFQLLLAQKPMNFVDASDYTITFGANPVIIENVAISIEKSSDMNRMVFNAINNIFINTVEQCASENIKFDVDDYNRRFRIMERARESSRNNYVEKVAVGDVVARKRIKTNPTTTLSSELKRYKSNKFLEE